MIKHLLYLQFIICFVSMMGLEGPPFKTCKEIVDGKLQMKWVPDFYQPRSLKEIAVGVLIGKHGYDYFEILHKNKPEFPIDIIQFSRRQLNSCKNMIYHTIERERKKYSTADTLHDIIIAALAKGRIDFIQIIIRSRYIATHPSIEIPALNLLAEAGHEAVCRILLRYGADINACDTLLKTPLMKAAIAGKEPVVELLLEKKADASLKDACNKDAFTLAFEHGNAAIGYMIKYYQLKKY